MPVKTEVRVFLDKADLEFVDEKLDDLGTNRSEVIRNIVKQYRRSEDGK